DDVAARLGDAAEIRFAFAGGADLGDIYLFIWGISDRNAAEQSGRSQRGRRRGRAGQKPAASELSLHVHPRWKKWPDISGYCRRPPLLIRCVIMPQESSGARMASLASPFPGMDPWLERFWGDVHHRLITYACDQIQELLPEGLLARMQERVFLEFPESVGRTVYPDGRIVETAPATPAAPPKAAGGVAVAEPLLVHLQSEPLTEGFIEVVDPASKGRVISVLEILSPANKAPGTGQSLYVQKQRELAAAGVSLVEVDLLRGGKRVTNAPPDILPRTHQTAYQACVRRATNSNVAEVYRIA